MEKIQKKISEIFEGIEIYPEYSSSTINITKYRWNGDMKDFVVEYFIEESKYVFHFNEEIAKALGINIKSLDPLNQLESEVKYVKRMFERGIGTKEYYPFTHRQEEDHEHKPERSY